MVLEALKEAQIGRMCVIVTHRLSAIRNANQIAVVHQGKVAEKGTHDQLIALQGHYFKMYQWQTKGITEGFR